MTTLTTSGLTRFEYNGDGLVDLMQSEGVQADLNRRAQAVRARLLDLYGDRPPDWEVIANVRVGRTRAVAIVSGVPLRVEYARRILGSAMDAAR